MAINTLDKLRSAVAYWADRDDLISSITNFSPASIDSAIDQAITFATDTIGNDLIESGGYGDMETVTVLSSAASTETISLPSDYKLQRALVETSNPLKVLVYKDPISLWNLYPDSTTDQPEAFTIIGATLYLRPIPDSIRTYRFVYYAAIEDISSGSGTNWLLTKQPSLYLAGALIELAALLEEDVPAKWAQIYTAKIGPLKGADKNSRWAAVPAQPSLQVKIV